MTRLAVIILNYRTPALTVDCLRSLAPEMAAVGDCRVIVVDNASGDSSVAAIGGAISQCGWSAWAELVVMPRNGGFAWGNNRGWDLCRDASCVLLLNSDTLVNAGCLAHCLKTMEGDERIGALSCQVLNSDGTIQNVTRRFPTPLNQTLCALGLPWRLPRFFRWADIQAPEWDRMRPMDVDWIGGAFMMVRGDLARRIGLLDEEFFFYGEDIEFCHRVWKAGYRVRFDPGASIVHLGGSSSGSDKAPDLDRQRQRWAARYLVQRKCHGRLAEWCVRWIDRCNAALHLAALGLAGKRGDARYANLKAQLATQTAAGRV
jgi:N-acetylglucosaminyl-diphospho-decaprenol L-rhamnosyltransferase